MSQDFKTPITVNGVPVSMQGHQHDFSAFPVLLTKCGKSTTQNYSANTTTKLAFNTVEINTGFIFDEPTERIYIPSSISGNMIVEVTIDLDLNGTSTMFIYLYINGVSVEDYYMSTALIRHGCVFLKRVNPNDYLELYIRGGTARTIQTATKAYIKQVA